MSCPDGYADCLCGTVPMQWNTNHGYILKQVVDEVGRNLHDAERVKVIQMINLGCTIRQMVAEVKRIECYAIANKRREVYKQKMQELGIEKLSGAASIKFKANVDIADGTTPSWEKAGYPAAYRSDIIEKSTKNKKQAKINQQKLDQELVKYQKEKLNCMNEVD